MPQLILWGPIADSKDQWLSKQRGWVQQYPSLPTLGCLHLRHYKLNSNQVLTLVISWFIHAAIKYFPFQILFHSCHFLDHCLSSGGITDNFLQLPPFLKVYLLNEPILQNPSTSGLLQQPPKLLALSSLITYSLFAILLPEGFF